LCAASAPVFNRHYDMLRMVIKISTPSDNGFLPSGFVNEFFLADGGTGVRSDTSEKAALETSELHHARR